MTEYVLATKWDDGDPCDPHCVGFCDNLTPVRPPHRFIVVDSEGRSFKAGGFRRAEKITQEEGAQLVAMFAEISDKPGPSLWWHLARIRGEEQPEDKVGWFGRPVSL